MLLHEKLKPYRVILASNSPRRRQMLKDTGIDYEVAGWFSVDEIYPHTLPAEDVPAFLSKLKSEAYPEELTKQDILITADTVVCLHGKIIGKPKDRPDAIRILESLSGHKHTVTTAVTLRTEGMSQTFSVDSDVFFRAISSEEIAYYVDTYKPFDKAGAYGIQEWIGYIGIERIEGSFYNVVGLPIQQLYLHLDHFINRMQGK